MKKALGCLLLILPLWLGGCVLFEQPDPVLQAVVAPEQGHVPYPAKIVATAPSGTFTFTLPDATIEQSSGVLDVIVDRPNWSATISWTDGEFVKTTTVNAMATNPRPTIHHPLINGVSSQWFLKPREETLIDFSYRPASMTSPTTGVEYADAWSIEDISVQCSEKLLCNVRIRDSIYCPPYERGVYHAIFRGALHENACLVYPTSTYELDASGLPYAPSPQQGYKYDAIQNRSVFKQIAFPAQTAIIRVVVRDQFGRHTSNEFEIPVLALPFETIVNDSSNDGSGDAFSDAEYFVASRDESVYHYSWCYRACLLAESTRIYYASRRHAEDSGRTICPYCALAQPGPCSCTGEDLDCEDFANQADAQACFDYCWSMQYGDVYGLDADGDGVACEELP